MDTPVAISSPSSSSSTSSSTTSGLELLATLASTPIDICETNFEEDKNETTCEEDENETNIEEVITINENKTTFEEFINDDATMNVADKNRYILGA